jgi:GNAT superfamily N-acetyltransferase
VGWSAYASDPDSLVRAIKKSQYAASATDSRANLVGLVRAISDDVSICYIQDLLVHPAHQRAGVGRALVERVLKRYAHVRQTVLITDDEPAQRAFYESIDFVEAHDFEPASLRAFVHTQLLRTPSMGCHIAEQDIEVTVSHPAIMAG